MEKPDISGYRLPVRNLNAVKFSKPRYQTGRQRRQARYRAQRPATRLKVWLRDGGRCIWPTCRRVVMLDTDNPYLLANIHELVNRSQGGDPCDADGCVTLCAECHMALSTPVGGRKKRIDGTSVTGSPLRFFERRTTREEWREVG